MFYLTRKCACGAAIRLRDSICKDCREKYGRDSSKWPEWFSYLIKQEQREVDSHRLHDFKYFLEDDFGVNDVNIVF